MARGPRRLRNLNLEVEDAEAVQGEHEDLTENEDDDDDNLQGPPEIDNILPGFPQQPAKPIEIIWPNGEVRQVLGDFRLSNMMDLKGGKIIVGTDESGVPNERSASILGQYLGNLAESPTFAPLHIPRWDNELFQIPKQNIIKDVEANFVFPAGTKQLTRDWILWTVNTRWRAYKSKLKKLYFNREERTLDEIIKGKPKNVNQHQWRALIGIWCQEKHKQLCMTNSRCAKEQKNPHTTGRKSHARLLKEMEDQRKEKVHKIELWDAAHKKKDGRYANNRVKTVMDTSFDELAKWKDKNNGNISAKDYAEVFEDVVAKQSKPHGYYDDKYWSKVKVSQGLTFVAQSDEEIRCQAEVKAMQNEMKHMSGMMNCWREFMARKFPEEHWINEMQVENDEVDRVQTVGDNDVQHDNGDNDIHYDFGDNDIDNNLEDSNANAHSPTNYVQRSHVQSYTKAKENCVQSSLPREHMISNTSEYPISNLGSRRTKLLDHSQSKSGKMEVYLISMRNKGKAVAKGNLVTTDSTRAIFGNVLGNEFYGVYVKGLENLSSGNTGDEKLPRPYENILTVKDAIGYVIAWPRTHVKKPKSSIPTYNNLHDGRM